MTRELKLALILGSSLVLVVGVLISDHLSGARQARIERVDPPLVTQPVTQMPSLAAGPQHEPSPQVLSYAIDDAVFQQPTAALADPVPAQQEPLASSTTPPPADLVRLAREHGLVLEPMHAAAQLDRVDVPEDVAVITMRDARSEVPAQANPGNVAPQSAIRTTEYIIQSGDTLWSLAERFMGSGTRHAELADLNKGRLGPSGELRLGVKIVVPAKDGAPASGAPRTSPADAAKSTPKKKTPATYTVAKGDTLRKIAAKTLGSEGRWRDIYEANRSVMKDQNTLRVGAVLKIPG